MTEQQKYFPTQQQEEKIFLLIRKHWFNYLIFFFITLLTILPVVVTVIYLNYRPVDVSPMTYEILIVVFSIFILFMLGVQLYGFVDYYLDIYIVTDQRIVDISQLGLFQRKISELQMRQVQDVSASVNGIFNTLLHFGDVLIQTAAERENFIFQSIPHPYTVAKQIVDLHEKDVESTKKKPKTQIANDSYDEGSLERGLLTKDVEDQAREMIVNKEGVEKPDHGFYIPKTNEPLIKAVNRRKKSGKASIVQLEGELQEGKEIKFE